MSAVALPDPVAGAPPASPVPLPDSAGAPRIPPAAGVPAVGEASLPGAGAGVEFGPVVGGLVGGVVGRVGVVGVEEGAGTEGEADGQIAGSFNAYRHSTVISSNPAAANARPTPDQVRFTCLSTAQLGALTCVDPGCAGIACAPALSSSAAVETAGPSSVTGSPTPVRQYPYRRRRASA